MGLLERASGCTPTNLFITEPTLLEVGLHFQVSIGAPPGWIPEFFLNPSSRPCQVAGP